MLKSNNSDEIILNPYNAIDPNASNAQLKRSPNRSSKYKQAVQNVTNPYNVQHSAEHTLEAEQVNASIMVPSQETKDTSLQMFL